MSASLSDSQLVTVAMPPGYKLLPGEQRRSTDVRAPMKPTVVRTIQYPCGATMEHTGRTPNEAVANAAAQAWMHWYSGVLDQNGMQPQRIEALPVPGFPDLILPVELLRRRPPQEFVNVPPGTGKTQAMVGAIVDAIRRGEFVTVASLSRDSADGLVERVAVELAGVMTRNEAREAVETGSPGSREEAPDMMRQGLQLPPGYKFDRAMESEPARVYHNEDGRVSAVRYVVTGLSGVLIAGEHALAGMARVLAAVRSWAHYDRIRRRDSKTSGLPHKPPTLPPGWTWAGMRQQARGWTVELRRETGGTGGQAWESHVAHAPSKHGAVELAQRQCWQLHKTGLVAGEAQRSLDERTQLADRLNDVVRRNVTHYTVPVTASGHPRAAAFVRILPPLFRFRDAAPVASAEGVSPTIYTDVVYYETTGPGGGEMGYSIQATDTDAHLAATKVALLAWDDHELTKNTKAADSKRTVRPGGIGSIGEDTARSESKAAPDIGPTLPDGYSFMGDPVPADDDATWAQLVNGPAQTLAGSGTTARDARTCVALKAWEQYHDRRRGFEKALREYEMFECDLIGVRGNKFGLPAGWVHVGGWCETADDRGYFRQARTLATNPDGSWENVVCGLGRTTQEATNDSIVRAWAAISRAGLGIDLPDADTMLEARAFAQRSQERAKTAQADSAPSGSSAPQGCAPGAKEATSDNAGGAAATDGICPLTNSGTCPAESCPRECPHVQGTLEETRAQMTLPEGYRWYGEPTRSRARPDTWVQEFAMPGTNGMTISGEVGATAVEAHRKAADKAWRLAGGQAGGADKMADPVAPKRGLRGGTITVNLPNGRTVPLLRGPGQYVSAGADGARVCGAPTHAPGDPVPLDPSIGEELGHGSIASTVTISHWE